VLLVPEGPVRGAAVLVSERGKVAAPGDLGAEAMLKDGVACFCIDVRGFGELQGLDPRLMAYLGTADAFAMGWDVARACAALREIGPSVGLPGDVKIGVVGRGATASQAVMFAALMEPSLVGWVRGLEMLREYSGCFEPGVGASAVPWRADLGAPLSHLRSLVRQEAEWTYRGDEQR
jgi:hypothetical protein